ncbi:peptidylprolyl isomerase [Halioglobus japonicus]|uniref:Peptidyl-prolyl cis-trans isomerase n=1 Tax=Halioglobus japonicus TaxID=930805 RepID=A0AAP8MGT2_9GAMM|nr:MULTISPECIES: peptidylprolyl isomerase [Halioglobus]AQA19458.1 peptidylprolyl isomerase [Halioglobus japonicus]KZX60581.1 peptidylprolyl isomerase [Halioglobus sp. HI00S01]PLW87485.1 peptidylprolyl isomerase [Halioglobus japonicus]GHD08209.1 peptidyl-prolyl cis-trans isomerase [Halioglobus japonicus]
MLKTFTLILALVLAPAAVAADKEETPLPNPLVTVKTSDGTFTLRLFRDKAPATVENFLKYVDEGFYNGTIFHRVIPDFMIQGGGFVADMSEKETHEPIKNESRNRLHNTRGTVAMARTNDPDSATSQFFVNLRNNLRLDWAPGRDGYTVFGEVIEGMKVIDFIATVPTGQAGPHSDVPTETVTIIEVKRKSIL